MSKVHPVYGAVAVALWVAMLSGVAGTVMYGPPFGTFAVIVALMATTCTIVAFVRGGHNWLMAHRMMLTEQAVQEVARRVLVELRREMRDTTVQIQPIPAFIQRHQIYASAPVPPPVPPVRAVADGTYSRAPGPDAVALAEEYRRGRWDGYAGAASDLLAGNDPVADEG